MSVSSPAHYFKNYQRRFFFLYGKVHDRFCLSTLELTDIDELLHRHLKSLGYRRIIYYKGGREKINFLDVESKNLSTLRNDQKDGTNKKNSRIRVCAGPLGQRKMLPHNAGSYATGGNSFHAEELHLGGMTDVDAVLLLDYCMCDSSCKTAVIFRDGLDFIAHTDRNAVRRMAGNLAQWIALDPVMNENICIFLFPSMDAEKLREFFRYYPEWNYLYNMMFDKNNQPSHGMIPLGPPHMDEVENLIHYWRIKYSQQPEWSRLKQIVLAETRMLRSKGDGLGDMVNKLKNSPVGREKKFTDALGQREGMPALEKLRSMPGMEKALERVEILLALQKERMQCRAESYKNDDTCVDAVSRLLPAAPSAGKKPGLHTVLIGNPGTGKTTLANLLSEIYQEAGLLELGHTVGVTRADLVAGYVGQTAIKTSERIADAMGGVLFIDEAYSLVEGGDNDFGKEAVTTVMEAMSAHEGEFAVILAGYPGNMNEFLNSNPGLRRRFGESNIINIPDYSPPVLRQIFEQKLADPAFFQDGMQRFLDKELQEMLPAFFVNWHAARDPNTFGNAGDVETLIKEMDGCRVRRVNSGDNSVEQRYTFTADDIPASCRKHLQPVAETFEAVMDDLNRLVGLRRVKEMVATLLNRMKIEKIRKKDKKISPGHYVFVGNPGTGKTTVARKMGEMFRLLGVLERGHVVEVGRSDLVGGYQGHSARQTRERLQEALDGVLFIDEAYRLLLDDRDTFGQEAYGELLQFMEDHRSRISIIVAGYPEPMQRFLHNNPGLSSRFTQTIEFDNYSAPEMMEIFKLMAGQDGFTLDTEVEEKLGALFSRWEDGADEHFGNARDVRKLFEAMCNRQGNRLALVEDLKPDEPSLYRLEPADLPADAVPKESKRPQRPMETSFIPLSASLLIKNYPQPAKGTHLAVSKPHTLVEQALLFLEVDAEGEEACGSGFLISPTGLAITCQHVVEGASAVRARVCAGGRQTWHSCNVLKVVEGVDIALLQLEGDGFPAVVLADPTRCLAKGHGVGVLSYPLGERLAADAAYTEGIVNSLRQGEHGELVQISALVYPGSSGGPVFSLEDGHVLGLLLGAYKHPEGRGINFFRPVSYAWKEFFGLE